MNIEAHDLDSLRKLIRKLQSENRRLKEQLKAANIAFDSEDVFEEKTESMEEYDPDQGGRIIRRPITRDKKELAKERETSLCGDFQDRSEPWKKTTDFKKSDVVGKMYIVLGDGVYVDSLNLMPRLQNQIRGLAAFHNPVFYKNKRLGYSNYSNFSKVYMGKDTDGYIRIPRGLREK